jgi:predicted NBD/HSP70 family sugar kinase
LLVLFEKVMAPFKAKGLSWQCASIASAGPLDPVAGVLLDPTNFLTDSKGWGVLPIVEKLSGIFNTKVYLENDAAAALLADVWKGASQGKKNVTLMTLGTGVGTAFLANGELVRSGRNLHTEASHISLNAWDKDHPCGCGAYGCVEAYLAGPHFAREVGKAMGRKLTGEDVASLARGGDKIAQDHFTKYGERLALAIRAYSMIFSMEMVVLGGGFSANADCFLEVTKQILPGLYERHRDGVDLLPEVARSPIHDVAGLLGAARVALLKS